MTHGAGLDGVNDGLTREAVHAPFDPKPPVLLVATDVREGRGDAVVRDASRPSR